MNVRAGKRETVGTSGWDGTVGFDGSPNTQQIKMSM